MYPYIDFFPGCCPSEAEIQEILVAIEDEETSGSIRLDRFLYTVSHIIQERRLLPASPEKLLKAFLTLDHDGKGYLTKEFLSKIMIEEGEPFTQEELDEMMAVVIDGETGNIPYEYYINHLMFISHNHTQVGVQPPILFSSSQLVTALSFHVTHLTLNSNWAFGQLTDQTCSVCTEVMVAVEGSGSVENVPSLSVHFERIKERLPMRCMHKLAHVT
ncbi:EF-hand calcium-binding domain-containing protein 2 [Zootermopsis nevadensis]|uniref:EF-hand calcium-binding domain-containing protein 2 n=1 Tax=Zootermopsis nevadensis TaxID=136037 RepID=A0A067QZ53_ZOONE|nr:EF-hand calcium-binding domain-containing protein 2 [Zootermopsis nevadensis]